MYPHLSHILWFFGRAFLVANIVDFDKVAPVTIHQMTTVLSHDATCQKIMTNFRQTLRIVLCPLNLPRKINTKRSNDCRM